MDREREPQPVNGDELAESEKSSSEQHEDDGIVTEAEDESVIYFTQKITEVEKALDQIVERSPERPIWL